MIDATGPGGWTIQLQISDGVSLGPPLYGPVPSVIVPADVNSPTFAWQLDSEPTVPGGGTYGLQANKQSHLITGTRQARGRHTAGVQQERHNTWQCRRLGVASH